jgi:hypothetical protein
VREEGKLGVGLGRLDGFGERGRMMLGPGDCSLKRVSLCSRPAAVTAGHLSRITGVKDGRREGEKSQKLGIANDDLGA